MMPAADAPMVSGVDDPVIPNAESPEFLGDAAPVS